MANGKNGSNAQLLRYVTTNRFYVEMESTIKASFTGCQGLGVTVKTETIHEGGANEQQRILLGPAEFTPVTLTRGITDDMAFLSWIGKLLNVPAKVERRNVNILTFSQDGTTQQCWTLIGAVPVEWQAPSLDAKGSELAIETLKLAYEGLQTTGKGGGAQILRSRPSTGYYGDNSFPTR